MKHKVVLATTNRGKVAEIRSLLSQLDFVDRPDHVGDVDETATTFEGNARLKATALVEATGLAAIADDSGLEVDALGGEPGVRSARYAGENATDSDNTQKLLEALSEVPDDRRRARFKTVVVLRYPDGRELAAEASVEGHIGRESRGDNGFGYDPVFVPDEIPDRTFGELSMDEKNSISHRGKALRRLSELLNTVD